MISTNKPFNDAPSEPIRSFGSVSGVSRIVWREGDGSSTSMKAYFLILRIHLLSLRNELIG